MADISVKRSKKSGLPAGSLIHIGEKKVQKTRIKVIDCGEKTMLSRKSKMHSNVLPLKMTRPSHG